MLNVTRIGNESSGVIGVRSRQKKQSAWEKPLVGMMQQSNYIVVFQVLYQFECGDHIVLAVRIFDLRKVMVA